MILISSDKSSTFETVDNENKCWIHTVDLSFVKSIDKNNLIGFKKNENKVIQKLKEHFTVPFINRIDNIIIFENLKEENIKELINKNEEIHIKELAI